MIEFRASDFAYGCQGSPVSPLYIISPAPSGTGSQTYTVGTPTVVNAVGQNFNPLATTTPVTLSGGAYADTSVTPSSVSIIPNQPSTFTVTVTYAHGSGTQVSSATFGLQEAINYAAKKGGGTVFVDGKWASLGGTTTILKAATNAAYATVTVDIVDLRGPSPATYVYNGTTYQAAGTQYGSPLLYSASGAMAVASSYAVITKSSALAALTLAAPTAAQDGMVITVTSRTAYAHTITATSLLNNGGAGVPYTTATFAAKPGASITLVADNQMWNVLYSTNVTLS